MKILSLLLVFSCGWASAQTLSNYQSIVTSQNPTSYFKFSGTLEDSVTPAQVLTAFAGFFSADLAHRASNSYAFVAQADGLHLMADIISGGDPTGTNAAANGVGSISLLFRALDAPPTGQRFLFSQGAGTTSNGNAVELFFENTTTTNGGTGDLKLRVGNVTTSILTSNAVSYREWYHFAMTYDETRDAGEVLWYLAEAGTTGTTGVLNIANDAVVGDNGTLALGNQVDLSSGYRNPGIGRIDEFATWSRELTAAEIMAQVAALPNLFPTNASYQQLVSAQIPTYYFKLNNTLVDAVGTNLTLTAEGPSGAFTNDILGNPNSAYTFDATNDALVTTNDVINGGGPGANFAATAVGSITLLFKMLSDTNNTGQRFIFSQGLGSSGTRNQMSLFIENTNVANGDPNSLKLRMGNGPTTTIVPAANLIPNAWYYFAMTYDEARDSQSGGEINYYIGPAGGSLTNGAVNIGNDAVIGDNGTFYIGNNNTLRNAFRNPGNGVIDEFAIWHDELSSKAILAQFAAASSTAPEPAPSLRIRLESPNVIISWPATTSPAYVLQSTASLTSPAWTTNGTPVMVGSEFVVTNAVSGAQFYRLQKF